MNNQFINFFIETYKRFTGPTPLYFKIISGIGAIATFIGFIPDIIVWLDLEIPLHWEKPFQRTLKIAGIITTIGARLPNQSSIAAMTAAGHQLKATNDNKLPFTTVVEKKKAAKNDSLPVVDNVSTNPEKLAS